MEANRSKILQFLLSVGLILALAFFTANSISAQNTAKEKSVSKGKLLKNAKNAIFDGDIFTATDNYRKYDDKYPGNAKVEKSLAYLYWKEKNYPEAQKYFNKTYRNDTKTNLIELFYSAKCLHTMGKYDEAKKEYERFASVARSDKSLRDYVKLAKSLAEKMDSIANERVNNNILMHHLDTSINGKHINTAPLPYENNTLIFGSLRENEITYYNKAEDTLPTRKFYIAKEEPEMEWSFVGEFDTVFNTNEYDVSNGAFSADKKRFFFTRCQNDDYGKKICEIYMSRLEDGVWQSPERLPDVINASGFTTTMPSLGISRQNTDVLYFVTDREGGRGGLDLWFSLYNWKDKTWKEAKNCGKQVNTVGDEITPFYDVTTRTLYYSSDGMAGFGGFDIYKTTGEGKSFNDIQNLGQPINSSYDDLYYTIDESRRKGFLSSNRDGGYSLRNKNCCDDIYEFIYRDHIVVAVDGKVIGITDSTFYRSIEEEYERTHTVDINKIEKSDKAEILQDYRVDLYMTDNEGKNYFLKSTTTGKELYFFNLERDVDYYISVKDFNNKEKRLEFTTKGLTHSDTLHLDPIIINSLPTRAFVVENIYYDFAKYNLREESKVVIDTTILKILNAYPKIIVEISSHTDSVGTDQSNMILSQNRAQSVVNYLIQKGISKDRLVAKGYGESKPIAPNSNPDGSDNPEGRQKNRRTEFRVIGHLDDDADILYEYD